MRRPRLVVRPVTVASHGDAADLAGIAAAATWDTPTAKWLVTDPHQRPGVLHAWYTILIEHALRHGRVDLLTDRSAAAIWLDRTRPVPAPSGFLRRLTATCGRHAVPILRYEQLLEQHRPRTLHHQLAVLASPSPERAAVLLAHRHERLDRMSVAAQSTAGSLEQLHLMTAAGYQPGASLRLPDGGPPIWPLWRPSRPVAAACHLRRSA